jgi:hypothetical protein
MTATYVLANLGADTAAGRLYRTRLAIGDTDTAAALLQDEEINYYLSVTGDDVDAAAVKSAHFLLVKYGAQPKSVHLPDGTSADFSDRVAVWRELIARLDTANNGMRIRRMARPQAVGGGGEYS